MIVTRADICYTDQDVYYYDETERYFLISCLALWYHNSCHCLSGDLENFICIGMLGKKTVAVKGILPQQEVIFFACIKYTIISIILMYMHTL